MSKAGSKKTGHREAKKNVKGAVAGMRLGQHADGPGGGKHARGKAVKMKRRSKGLNKKARRVARRRRR